MFQVHVGRVPQCGCDLLNPTPGTMSGRALHSRTGRVLHSRTGRVLLLRTGRVLHSHTGRVLHPLGHLFGTLPPKMKT